MVLNGRKHQFNVLIARKIMPTVRESDDSNTARYEPRASQTYSFIFCCSYS